MSKTNTEAALNHTQQRIDELEVRYSFSEQLLTELNDALVQQASDIKQLRQQVQMLTNRLGEALEAQGVTDTGEEPPPHY